MVKDDHNKDQENTTQTEKIYDLAIVRLAALTIVCCTCVKIQNENQFTKKAKKKLDISTTFDIIFTQASRLLTSLEIHMKNLKDIKARMLINTTMTMTGNGLCPNGTLVGVPRKIITKQTNAVEFEGGSWWTFPPAKSITILSKDSFRVTYDEFDDWMEYTFSKNN